MCEFVFIALFIVLILSTIVVLPWLAYSLTNLLFGTIWLSIVIASALVILFLVVWIRFFNEIICKLHQEGGE